MDKERQRFEEWYEADAMPAESNWFRRDPDAPDEYDRESTCRAWQAWQAASQGKQELLDALQRIEIAANTADYCYRNHPGNFTAALRDLELAAADARAAIAKHGA